MHKHLTAMLAAGLLLVGGSAYAHHPFAAEYDSNKPAHLQGKVTKVEWTNPHGFLTIKGRADDGKEETFKVELGSPKALEQKGWKRGVVSVGDEVTIVGWYARDAHSRINAQGVKLDKSGRELDAASSFYAAPAGN
jgi:Family of unknown function (DUF6152)